MGKKKDAKEKRMDDDLLSTKGEIYSPSFSRNMRPLGGRKTVFLAK